MPNPYLQALLIQPPVILDTQLRPFSAFHLLALQGFDNPFVTGGTVDFTDILSVVFICSLSYSERDKIMTPDKDYLKQLGETYAKTEDKQTITGAINTYISDYVRFPEIWNNPNSLESAVPFPFKLVGNFLSNYSGFTEEQAWDMPINKLVCYNLSVGENSGLQLKTEKQQELETMLYTNTGIENA